MYGDEDVEHALKMVIELSRKFGAGFLEDIIPFMSNIYTTQRWKDTMTEIDEWLALFKKLVNDHEDTFDPSMYIIYLFKVSYFNS